MIDFMVIAAPRSGTGWISNWLTTDSTLCYHGLSARKPMDEWETIQSHRMLGTAETALWWAAKKLNRSPARKVILHRDPVEICDSLGMPEMLTNVEKMQESLNSIDGMHIPWDKIFDDPKDAYEYLLQRPYGTAEAERHEELIRLQVTCMPKRVTFDRQAFLKMKQEMLWN